MIPCPACAREAPPGSLYCPSCGCSLEAVSLSPTQTAGVAGGQPAGRGIDGRARSAPSDPLDQPRFLPGAVLASRYRVIGLLGKGGMGEVYRADDLKLGQAVALKFLPANLDHDQARLTSLLNEVKLARLVSHPNVCRVYDVGEAEGHHFLSMEYVDGEDLATLLRRIGRLPEDKAVQIARELCAGLSAAHEQGVIHRDLKPANVMIDGRGRTRITDFGLAGFSDRLQGAEARGGTPAYMAPEQFQGRGVSIRSDLYSLGLVLYELFTGASAFRASTSAEMARLKVETTPTNPSRLVEGFDPAVERVILRCLEPDPRHRPPSALAVAAALPGGDPLAAALAAGETPSPELVAEAGAVGGLSPAQAAIALGSLLFGFLLAAALSSRTQFVRIVPLPKPPEVLAERAREVIRRLGYSDPPRDSKYGFDVDSEAIGRLHELDPSMGKWDRLSARVPGALFFWYREGPEYLIPGNDLARTPTYEDPPLLIPGATGVRLDPAGRLRLFETVPPGRGEAGRIAPDPDWNLCFVEAGLDPSLFHSVDPARLPRSYADRRAAWEGHYRGEPGAAVRVEAASYLGKPVSFRVLDGWASENEAAQQEGRWSRISWAILGTLSFLTLIGGGFLARRNIRLGRGDRKGAVRLAVLMLSADYLAWLLKAHHVPVLSELRRIFLQFSLPLLLGAVVWVFYLALEPAVRRLWPRTLVSWVRLLDGRFRDPLVGRDVLLGLILGTGMTILSQILQVVAARLALPVARPDNGNLDFNFQIISLRGLRYSLGNLAGAVAPSLAVPLLVLVLILLLRILLRRQWLALGTFLLLAAFLVSPPDIGASPYFVLAANLLGWAVLLTVLFRVGLLAYVVSFLTLGLLSVFPLTLDLSAWYAGNTVLVALVTAGLAAYATRVSLAGRPLLRDPIFQE